MKWYGNLGVADRYGVSPRTVERWRLEGKGPAYHKFGRHVRYSDADLAAWEEKQRRTSTSEDTASC